MFVPLRFELSESGLSYQFAFGAWHSIDWARLSSWGENGSFMIRFDGLQTLQICSEAFPPEQWSRFMGFLESNYPEQKTNSWLVLMGLRSPLPR